MATLKLAGKPGDAGTLGFLDAGRTRIIRAGSLFEAGDELAAILLATDPNVTVATADELAAGGIVAGAPSTGSITRADLPAGGSTNSKGIEARNALIARAKDLGVTSVGKSADIEAAIVAEEARLAAAAAAADPTQGGSTTPADDPEASASGEAGTPPDAAGDPVVLPTGSGA